jgi:Tol biopolymer transport system component
MRPFSPRFHEERIGRVVAASRVLEASVAVTVLTAIMLVCIAAAEPAGAAFRGANGKIFFESTRTGSSQIFSMNPNGSGVTNVTSNRSLNEENPAVLPSGLKVAYEYAREVWVMNVDGTGKRRVVGNTGGDATPSWSPDGKKIVFSRNRADIWVVNVDGTGQKRLTFTPNHQEYDPAYSPDGTKIAYTLSGFGALCNGTCIYVMNAGGAGQRSLTPEENVDCPDGGSYSHDVVSHHASWSPNGSRIAFRGAGGCAADGSVTGGLNIWRMNPDGSGKRQLTNDENTSDDQPAYSPDGTKIAFVSDRDSNAAFPKEIYTMNAADGSGIRRLTANGAFDGHPDWQPRR